MGRAQLHLFRGKLKEDTAYAETATNFDVASYEESYVRANTPDDAQAAYLHARILQHDGNSEAVWSALASAASVSLHCRQSMCAQLRAHSAAVWLH